MAEEAVPSWARYSSEANVQIAQRGGGIGRKCYRGMGTCYVPDSGRAGLHHGWVLIGYPHSARTLLRVGYRLNICQILMFSNIFIIAPKNN